MGTMKILIADDEPDVLAVMARQVASQGYAVVTAQDGQEAWEKIQSESPDIILLDLNMPKLHGFDVLRALREHPPLDKWQPVIIISTRSELEDVKQGISLEAEHYLIKPCTIEDILKAIKIIAKLIAHHKTPRELGLDNISTAEREKDRL